MKTLIAILLLTFGIQAQASDIFPQQMTAQQKVQLLHVLNQMDAEVLSAVLSEEGLQWYIEQYNRRADNDFYGQESSVEDSRIESDENPYLDPNAPKFL